MYSHGVFNRTKLELIDKLEEGQSKKLLKDVTIRQPSIILGVAAMLSKDQPPSEPGPSGSSPSWCVFVPCVHLRLEMKIKCAVEMRITFTDTLTLHIQLVFRNGVFAEQAVSLEDSNYAYRDAAFRQYSLWVHGRLQKDDR
ncbi:hypothetical protein ACF0H5_018691 [Mactra antiquata]